MEIEACNKQECPINGYFSDWEEVGECSKPCGGGLIEMIRSYIPAKFGGVDLPEDARNKLSDVVSCNKNPCPVDGHFGPWGEWGDCSEKCGGGIQKRTRTYIKAINGGVDLPVGERTSAANTIEVKECNNFPCPIDGFYTEWEECPDGTVHTTLHKAS